MSTEEVETPTPIEANLEDVIYPLYPQSYQYEASFNSIDNEEIN
jgi:hypothetical protein